MLLNNYNKTKKWDAKNMTFLLYFILILLAFLPFLYLIVAIVDEDEKYETYLLYDGNRTYLLVKERNLTIQKEN